MAIYRSIQAAESYPIYQPDSGESAEVAATLALSTALVIGDTVRMLKLPAGAKVSQLRVMATDMDTGATLACDVGTGQDADAFKAAVAFSAAVDVTYPALASESYVTTTAETWVGLTCTTAAATFAAGTVKMICRYTETITVSAD